MSLKNLLFTVCLIIFSQHLYASHSNLYQELLDIHGNGRPQLVPLPYPYFQREPDDHLTFIHECGYKIYDIERDQHEVAVIGFLNPCIGVVVSDGVKVAAIHKSNMNLLSLMVDILKANLNLNSNNLIAHLFSCRNDTVWNQSFMARDMGISHNDEMNRVVNSLKQHIGIDQEKILSRLYKSESNVTSDEQVGKYYMLHLCVAVRLNKLFDDSQTIKQLKFSSINPFSENLFEYSNDITYDIDVLLSVIVLIEYRGMDPSTSLDKQLAMCTQLLNMAITNFAPPKYEAQRLSGNIRKMYESHVIFRKLSIQHNREIMGQNIYDEIGFCKID